MLQVLHTVTRCFIVLQGVTQFQGVTQCYRYYIVLQGVTQCYILLQGVT